ncbi:MAG: pyocin activator PrtN family protein [Pseudomonas sp.]|uniref:pyocin activator PrtN family protein n=1 Tax=Pseudomonas sp. TaxID=306 RepID=UPI003BB6E1CF
MRVSTPDFLSSACCSRIPLETLRARYFRNLNIDTFRKAIGARISLPITTLDPSRKGEEFIDIRHFAAYLDARAYRADESMARDQATEQEPGCT